MKEKKENRFYGYQTPKLETLIYDEVLTESVENEDPNCNQGEDNGEWSPVVPF